MKMYVHLTMWLNLLNLLLKQKLLNVVVVVWRSKIRNWHSKKRKMVLACLCILKVLEDEDGMICVKKIMRKEGLY